ncbi:MAG: PilT/PilU family type 4a pilus ATPase [Oscillospiraceae bacterium]|nr:PilT/PilU family type 4a pilus ATPase [Oscillospiraceae bacterium]
MDNTMKTGRELVLDWLRRSAEEGASDLFISAGRQVTFKINGVLYSKGGEVMRPHESEEFITILYELAHRSIRNFLESGDDDFPITVPGVARFRVNAFRQRGTYGAVIRIVLFNIPDYKDLQIPDEVMSLASELNGLALVTGPAGSGKSTTLACIIDAINKTRNSHIITLEDPIEYLHKDKESLVSQREISTDTNSYMDALRASLRQAPDIILLGEMRDHETIKTAITAAETGHLVISTLHTVGAANTIDRIVDIFPPAQQQQVRVQLSMSLRMVVTQRLLTDINGESIPAFEIMRVNSAISNIIREGKTQQIDGVIQTSSQEGMIGMDTYIMKLYQDGKISKDTALHSASNHEQMQRKLSMV